ncbi:alpha/beta hydrolase [Natronomonas sp. F2-12]|jgi:pimeloyl-ACP methyl ester carboxylesterase|uniref:Alpha/beta hydrolase n=1 Tax=Natronomonas aquatica TaxID=2841590 RepID=A0A9R1D6N9_9EURY|nr:alpha/beta hydrolase [Natronomonas aquatica]MCQ4333673.1 alpha/beta hydrolase [Natronomonas aquatica]
MSFDHEAWSGAQSETTVSVDGHELSVAYYEGGPGSGSPDGEPTDAETLVFLHGVPTWSFLWRRIAPAFEEKYRVIVPDLLGYGNSDRRDSFDRSIRAQEEMLGALLDGLGERRVTLVAHDIGGGAALRFAASAPDRVDRLVASNAVCYDSWPVEFVSGLGLPETETLGDGELEGKLDFAFAEGTYGEADPEFVAGMKAPWLRADGKRALARAAVATNTNHTTEIDYGAIDAEVLCLWGSDDVLQPVEYGERLAEDLDGRVVELEDAYHWVLEDRPEAYREELRAFLTETDGAGGEA